MLQLLSDRLLYLLQAGIPLSERPFADLGAPLDLTSEQVLQQVEAFRAQGLVRRIGGVFNAVQFDYQSALCGIAASLDRLEDVVATLKPQPGITHCYSRSARLDGSVEPVCEDGFHPIPNLWFTLSVPREDFDATLASLQAHIPFPIRVAPATRRFKVQVVLDPAKLREPTAQSTPDEIPFAGTEIVKPSEAEKRLIRALQEDIPMVEQPWNAIAASVGMETSTVLSTLQRWKACGALRRVALLARHQKMGFSANAMCTWLVPEDQVETIGLKLAGRSEVTHCYRREPFDGFRYNLFAMIHSDTEAHVRALAQELSAYAGVMLGILFMSAQEYKKTSLKLFAD